MVKRALLLVGSLVASGLMAAPAEAGKLKFWRFNQDDNRLLFQTEDQVQPKAQLIFNPTRVVIDLPSTTLGHSLVNQPVGEVIKEVRVGQFNPDTTRMVIELAPGYTLDPEKVKIRGEGAKAWSVELPPPQRQAETQRASSPPKQELDTRERRSPLLETKASPEETLDEIDHPNLQVTRSGLLLRLDETPREEIEIKRSQDQKQISFRIPKLNLPSELPPVLPIGEFGISYAEFKSNPRQSSVEIILHVNEASPNWQGFPTLNGLVLLPEGGMGAVRSGIPSPPIPRWVQKTIEESQRTVIEAVDLVENQLLIRANRPITGTGNWDRFSGVYEIKIPQAELADPVQGPRLTRNSPVSQIRVRQEDEETVVVQVQAAPGVNILDRLNQPSESTLAVAMRRLQPIAPRNTQPSMGNINTQPQAIRVPQTRPKPSPPPSPTTNNNQDELLVVLDPGHGGKDPGAVGIGGLQEKNVVLPISHHVRKTLESNGLQVKMTRWDDRFISLAGRSEMANRLDADLFISIHANAISMSRPDVNGAETFYYSSGRALAQAIQRRIISQMDMRDRGVKQANFYVLRNSAMPAVLVEVGFVTGRLDAPRLADPQFRQRMADAIADGILQYVRQTQ